MDIPSLFMIPSAVSSGKVHSVFPNSTDADFDFNRDSDATRVNSEGLIERVGYYGSEKITNGNFTQSGTPDTSTYTLGWYSNTGGVNISNGSLTLTNGASDTDIRAYATNGVFSLNILTTNINYKLEFDIVSNQGSTDFEYYSAAGAFIDAPLTVGRHTINIKNTSNQLFLFRNKTPNSSITLDNVSIKQINGDRARLNYEIEGGLVNTKPSLLLEPSRTNFVDSSENANGWSAIDSNITKTDNAIISPDGLNNGTKLESLTKSSANQIVNFGTTSLTGVNVVGKTYTGSVFIKPVYSSDVGKKVTFSIQRIAGDFEGLSVTFTIDSADWKRYEMTFTYTGTGAGNQTGSNFKILKASTTIDDIYIWGVMLEEGSYATSYIPTNGSTQTRAAETCNGAGTSSIFESSEGILYAEIAALADDLTFRSISINDGTSNEAVIIRFRTTSNRINGLIRDGGSAVNNLNFDVTDIKDFHKVAYKFKTGDCALYVDGTEVATGTASFTLSTQTTLNFNNGVGDIFYGKVRDIRVYNTKEMTDSEVDILLTKITS